MCFLMLKYAKSGLLKKNRLSYFSMFLFLTTNYLNLFDIIIYVKSPPAFVDELPFSAHSFASHPEKKTGPSGHRN